MNRNSLGKKGMATAVIFLFLGMSVIPSISASSDGDIEITISAGLFRRNWGCFGYGWVIVVYNNGNEPINGSCEIDYYTLSGDDIRREEVNFNLGPLTEFGYEGVNIIDFPPINQLTITVEAGGHKASRFGIEIGPFVFLLNKPPIINCYC